MAGDNGLCVVHSGKLDLREVGKLGGRGRTRSVLGLDPSIASDDKLRRKAKRVLEAQLDSEDPKVAQAAARSLFSYSPGRAPLDEDEEDAPANVDALLRALLKPFDRIPADRVKTLISYETANMMQRTWLKTEPAAEMEQTFEAWTVKLGELSRRRQAGAVPAGKDVRPAKQHVHPPAEPVPSAEVPVPPSKGEARRAAELKAAQEDWAERDADPEPSEYSW